MQPGDRPWIEFPVYLIGPIAFQYLNLIQLIHYSKNDWAV